MYMVLYAGVFFFILLVLLLVMVVHFGVIKIPFEAQLILFDKCFF